MHVHGAATPVIVEAPHTAQQGIAAVRTTRVRHQKRQQRILQIREIKRLSAYRYLVRGKVDGHVVHGNEIGRRAFVSRPQQLTDARGAFGIRGTVHHEIAFHLHGQAELGKLLLVDDNQKRCGTIFKQHGLNLRDVGKRIAARLVNYQVIGRMLRKQLLELHRRARRHINIQARKHLLELMGVVKAVGYEYDHLSHCLLPFFPITATALPKTLQHRQVAIALPLRHVGLVLVPLGALGLNQVVANMAAQRVAHKLGTLEQIDRFS